jgi:hypothetical protein
MAQIVVQIAADGDDGRDDGTNWVFNSSLDQIGFSSVKRSAGFRFIGITIAAGATITSAKITVKQNNFDTGSSLTTLIAAWKTNNPAQFDNTNRPSVVTQTTANVSWTYNTATNQGQVFDSPDISSIISELYTTFGFNNSSLSIVVIGNASGDASYLEDFFAGTGHSAILTINYTPGGDTLWAASSL